MSGALAVACTSRWTTANAAALTSAAAALASVLRRPAPEADRLATAGAAAALALPSCRPLTSLPAEDGSSEPQHAGAWPPPNQPQPLRQPQPGVAPCAAQSSTSSDSGSDSDAVTGSGGGSSGGAHPAGPGGLQVTPQALATAAAIMARFPAVSWDPERPRLVDVAMQLLLELKAAGASEEEQHAACSEGQRLRALRRRLRVGPCLEALFGDEAAARLLDRRPALLATTPPNMARALAAMALCGVHDPTALAARSPVLLQYRHDSFSFVTARLAMQQYLGLPDAAAVYERLPTYLLPSAFTVACRLQFLEDRGLLPGLVARLRDSHHLLLATLQQAQAELHGVARQAVAATATQQQQQPGPRRRPGRPPKARQQGQGVQQQQQPAQRGPGRPLRASPPSPTLSGVVKRGVAEFCLLLGAPVEEYRQYEAAFERHPAWQRLRDRGQRDTEQLRALLRGLEQQAVVAAARREAARQQQA